MIEDNKFEENNDALLNEQRKRATEFTEFENLQSNINWKQKKLHPLVKNIYEQSKEVKSMSKEDVTSYRENNLINLVGSEEKSDDVMLNPIASFDHIEFPEFIKEALEKFEEPTPIQAQSWSIILQGNDMIGIAETGSGKTLSFVIPAILHLLKHKHLVEHANHSDKFKGISTFDEYMNLYRRLKFIKRKGPYVVILSPTRELASQIAEVCSSFSDQISVGLFTGGDNREQQVRLLKKVGIDICVATPGRLLDFLNAGMMSLENVSYFVMDEADMMIDLGFMNQTYQIGRQIRPDKQTLLFSATWRKRVQQLAKEFLNNNNTIIVNIGSISTAANINVKQEFEFIKEFDKYERLKKLLDKHAEIGKKMLIFCRARNIVDEIVEKLRYEGWPCLSLHGERSQVERTWIMEQFKTGETPILIATDVAARGLDIKDIKLVINYNMPTDLLVYVHRIGRTGRAGNEGHSISFFSPSDIDIAPNLLNQLKQSQQEVPQQLEKICNSLNKKRAIKEIKEEKEKESKPDYLQKADEPKKKKIRLE